MPNTILSIDQYSVVVWDNYAVVTLLSHLQPHHVSLLEECIKTKDIFKKLPAVVDCMRLNDISLRERELLLNLKDKIPQYSVLSNPALNTALQKAGVYHLLPVSKDFKSALETFGVTYHPKLEADLVNAFVESTVKVFSAQTGQVAGIGKPVAQKTPILQDVFGMIPTQSTHFSGMVLLSFSEAVLRNIFMSVFGYEPEKVQCELEGFLSELLELIYDTTRSHLMSKGFVFYPSVASVLRKASLSQHLSAKQVFLNVPLTFGQASFQVCIGAEAL